MSVESVQQKIEKRDKIEIVLSILGTVESGEHRPTRIMARSNINYVALKSILKNIEEAGFVTSKIPIRNGPVPPNPFKKKHVHTFYFITDKGARFLHFCREVYKVIEENHLHTAITS